MITNILQLNSPDDVGSGMPLLGKSRRAFAAVS